MSVVPSQAFLCVACDSLVDQPTVNMQLEVFMDCSTLKDFTVKVKVRQDFEFRLCIGKCLYFQCVT